MKTNTLKATKKEWFGLAVIALPCMLYSMDLTVLNLAVPKLTVDLNPSGTQLLWIVDIYGFLLAGFLITMGTLGDRIGRRKLLMIGAAAFGLASVLAAFSSSAELLILARAILGVAGATLAPSTLSLISNMFRDEKERTTAIAVWITAFSLGGAVGPVVGGIMLEHYWWGSVFLIAIPVMVLLLIVGPILLPEFKDPDAGKIDIVSAALSLAMIIAIIYGIKTLSIEGFSWPPLASTIIGVSFGLIFIKRQKHLKSPFIDLHMFRIPAFSSSLIIYMFSTFILFGTFFFIAQFLQLVLGLSPLVAGLWTLPSFAGFIIGSMTTPGLSKKFKVPHIVFTGLLIAAIGFGLVSQIGHNNGLVIVVSALAIFSLGIAPVFTLATDMVVGSAPPEQAGSAASLSETSSELGGALGIAILGSIGTLIFKKHMTDANGIDTLGAAASEAGILPPELGSHLLNRAQLAFVEGMKTTAIICMCIAILLATIVWIYRKKIII